MSLRVDLSGNGTGFEQMLAKARAQAKAFSNSVTHEISSSWLGVGKSFAAGFAGMFTVQSMKSSLDWFINTGKEIKETAEQVDMSTDSWQKWAKAVELAGLSTNGFMRVIEALRQKRTDALTDPKARGELSRLGFSDAEITGDMDMSEFAKLALGNASGGDLQRKYLADIIGARGLKYATALDKLPQADADFSTGDLQEAQELTNDLNAFHKAIGQATIAVIRFFSNTPDGEKQRNLTKNFWAFGVASDRTLTGPRRGVEPGGQVPNPWKGMPQDKLPSGKIATPNDASASGGGFIGPMQPPKDPMDAKLAAQREELALHEQERQQRLIDSQRGLMTIGDRRASILGEMPGLQKQIADRNAKMKGEGFLTDAQRDELAGVTGKAREFSVNALRTKYRDDTDNLQLRYNKDRGDLREKPLAFSEDNMSKVGLYSASSVAFNPLLAVQKKANELLTKIAHNTVPRGGNLKDPYSP